MAGTFVSDTIQDGAGNSTSTTNCIKGSAKAWVNFTGSTAVINGSYNVSSVTRTSTGVYQVNYTTVMPNANYCATASISSDTYVRLDVYTTSSIRAVCGAAAVDVAIFSVAIISL